MSDEPNPAPSVIRQFIETDAFFGVREVPIPRAALVDAFAARPSVSASASASISDSRASGAKDERLALLNDTHVRNCRECKLADTRTKTVFGAGNADARLVFVGEGPGFHEDKQGIPFVGAAGDLLTKMIVAMKLSRDEVYICNIVKCRPPNNRDPVADEVVACSPYLYEQLRIISPEVIVALGSPAAKTLLETSEGIGRLRGRFHEFQLTDYDGNTKAIDLMPTYHPAYLLRSPQEKRKAWADLQMVMKRLRISVD